MVNRTAPLLTRPRFRYGPAGIWDPRVFFERWSMTIVPLMWSVWGALVLLLIILKMYNSRLTRDEDDQLILDDSFNHIKAEQDMLMAKIHKLEPIVRVATGLAAAATLFVIVYYVLDMISQFK